MGGRRSMKYKELNAIKKLILKRQRGKNVGEKKRESEANSKTPPGTSAPPSGCDVAAGADHGQTMLVIQPGSLRCDSEVLQKQVLHFAHAEFIFGGSCINLHRATQTRQDVNTESS